MGDIKRKKAKEFIEPGSEGDAEATEALNSPRRGEQAE